VTSESRFSHAADELQFIFQSDLALSITISNRRNHHPPETTGFPKYTQHTRHIAGEAVRNGGIMSGRLNAAEEKEILLNLLCDPDDTVSLRLLQLHHDELTKGERQIVDTQLTEHHHQYSHSDRSSDTRARSSK
jgi:hypothetical protein